MDEFTNSTPTLDAEEEYEPILPEGYTAESDFFDQSTWGGTTESGSASAGETADSTDSGSAGTTATSAPATEQQAEAGEMGTELTNDNAAPAIEPGADSVTSPKRKVKYQFNHQDVEEEFDDADLPEIFQKARSVDRYKERATKSQNIIDQAERTSKSLGYKSAEEMLSALHQSALDNVKESLLDKGVPQEIVDDYVGRKFGIDNAVPTVQTSEPEPEPPAQAQGASPSNGVQNEVLEFFKTYPDMVNTQLPPTVLKEWAAGKELKTAYKEYMNRSVLAENERVNKENAILRQNAASAARAPVSGVSKGGSVNQKSEDPFSKALSEDYW